jgi:hypothetical protein
MAGIAGKLIAMATAVRPVSKPSVTTNIGFPASSLFILLLKSGFAE